MIVNIFLSLLLIVLVFAIAFFASTETAFMSLSKITIRQMLRDKIHNAKKISHLKNNLDSLITTNLIGINFINSLSSAIATALAISLFGNKGPLIATFVMAALVTIFGEVLPKTIAAYHPEKIAVRFATPLVILEKLFFPAVKIFSLLIDALSKISKKTDMPIVTEEELKTLIEIGNIEGTLEKSEKNTLYKIFEFADLRINDIMRHRSKIIAVDETATFSDLVQTFSKTGFSRIPVCKETVDTIVGIVHYKDLIFKPQDASSFDIRSIMYPPLFVPETNTVYSLLHLLKKEKQNLAIAIDEYGSISGIITVDDVMKAVFGGITNDYSDNIAPEDRITPIKANKFLMPGDTPLDVVNDVLALNLESEYFFTIGGWIMEQFGVLPETGESITRDNIIYTVEDQSNHRINYVSITR